MRGSVYEQPGTRVDRSNRSKEGSKKVRGAKKGEQKGNQQREISNGKAPHVF
jgi:hypothetical protein